MKGKPDVSHEESHIPLHFLILKEAAQFTPMGGGNWSVYTGGGSDAVGTMLLSPARLYRSPGPHSRCWVFPGYAVAFLADGTILLLTPSASPSLYCSLKYPFSGAARSSLHQTPWRYVEETFLFLEKRKENAGGEN